MSQPLQRPIILEHLKQSDAQVEALAEELVRYTDDYGLILTHEQAVKCVLHLLYVEQVNSYINLTRITDLHEAVILHILDSLLIARYVPGESDCFLDMGTGAGFPGVPAHILTGKHGVLLDSVGKKVRAVEAIAHEIRLTGISAVHARLEDYALDVPERFDCVFARALAPSSTLLEYAAPFLSMDGSLIVAKANMSADERSSADRVAALCGLDIVDQHEFDLPHALGHRVVQLFHKVRPAQVSLPRAPGMAKRNPLA